ncbi:MAG: site-2 protease family protein [Sedimentisphaerales bacterium]|nr:site-2 protease family protein [Sedimentisphaerales bacterium]
MELNLALATVWYAVFIVSLTFHEAAHAFAALKFGDPTAYYQGQVTLDPIPHIKRSPFGMVIVPIVSYILGGWMIGWASAPYDPYWADSNRRKAALMAMAGPAANLVLILLAALAIRAGMLMGYFHAPEQITFSRITAASPGPANAISILISILFSLNLVLLAFNLIPLPPLDGSSILTFFLSDQAARRYNAVIKEPQYRLIGLIVAWHMLDFVLRPVHTIALNLLYPGAGYH